MKKEELDAVVAGIVDLAKDIKDKAERAGLEPTADGCLNLAFGVLKIGVLEEAMNGGPEADGEGPDGAE